MKLSEIALILAMFITFTYSAVASSTLEGISEKVIRFHVIANSNSEKDQQLKLIVKDEVFAFLTSLTQNASTTEHANSIITKNLDEICKKATQVVIENGFDYPVSITLENEFYPQKDYDNFSLPSGYYNGLKINIGQALGENWWCVIFPPLCNQTAMDVKNLNPSDIDFITHVDYEFRFKFIDTLSQVKQKINN